MKQLLLFIGKVLSYVYPYSLHKRVEGGLKIIYTSWATKNFFSCGDGVKFGFHCHLVGNEHIVLGSDIFVGDGSAITAFAISNITPPMRLQDEPIITIGDHCMFGNCNHITAVNGIIIGKNLRTGKNVLISDNSHGNPKDVSLRDIHPNERPLYSKGEIIIGDNVWIGENAAILGSVHIGDGAIIGVNTVVTHDIPPYAIAVGIPAKILKN